MRQSPTAPDTINSGARLHVLAVEPFRQVRRDVAGAVVGEKPWPVDDLCLVEPRGLQRQVQRGGDILGLHGWARSPESLRLRVRSRSSFTSLSRRGSLWIPMSAATKRWADMNITDIH